GWPERCGNEPKRFGGEPDGEFMPGPINQWLAGFEGIANHGTQVYPLPAQLDLSTSDSGDFKQVVYQPYHLIHLAPQHVMTPAYRLLVGAHAHNLECVADRGEGVPQLVGQGCQELVLPLIRFPQGVLGPLDVGDVCRAADETEHLAILIKTGNCGNPEPAIFSVGAPEPELHLEGLALAMSPVVGGDESRRVGWMEQVLPRGALEPAEITAGELEILPVHELVAIGSGQPDQ